MHYHPFDGRDPRDSRCSQVVPCSIPLLLPQTHFTSRSANQCDSPLSRLPSTSPRRTALRRRASGRTSICRSSLFLLIPLATLLIGPSYTNCFDLSQFHRRFSQLGFSPSSEAASEGRSALLHFDSGPGSSSGANHDHGLQGSASLTSETADSASGSYHFHDKHRLEPLFDNTTSRNITTTAGKTVYLPCRVRSLADRTVSWIRRADLHVLTIGKFTYTSDERFKAMHLDNSDDWSLQVRYPQTKDAGVYECQLSTMPKRSIFVSLNVVTSSAKIIGGSVVYVNSGATLQLSCLVNETPGPPDYIFWHHNGEVINYDSLRGVKVQTEKSAQTSSTLTISKAHPSDSGNYSCVPSNALAAHIAVHVLNSGSPAAMQHGKRSAGEFVAGRAPSAYQPMTLVVLLLPLITLGLLSSAAEACWKAVSSSPSSRATLR